MKLTIVDVFAERSQVGVGPAVDAEKNTVPFTSTKFWGSDCALPGQISIRVGVVPSTIISSRPPGVSNPEKNNFPLEATSDEGSGLTKPPGIEIEPVPEAVPSLRHNLPARLKYRVLPTATASVTFAPLSSIKPTGGSALLVGL